MRKLIDEFLSDIERLEQSAHKLGKKLVKILKPFIRDIEYSIGWEEAGIDTICLWSKSRNRLSIKIDNYIPFEMIVEEIMPELSLYIECPFGVYVRKA